MLCEAKSYPGVLLRSNNYRIIIMSRTLSFIVVTLYAAKRQPPLACVRLPSSWTLPSVFTTAAAATLD